jgi:hypothetical protein
VTFCCPVPAVPYGLDWDLWIGTAPYRPWEFPARGNQPPLTMHWYVCR